MRTDRREMLAVGILGGGSELAYRIESLLRCGRVFSARASRAAIGASAALLCGLALFATVIPRVVAFAQSSPRPVFEVAAVKLSDQADQRLGFHLLRGGRLSASNLPLKLLMAFAYDVPTSQISGGPAWVDSVNLNIEARAANAPDQSSELEQTAQYRQMVQSLLADRFRLSTHVEERQGQVYRLLVAKGGPRLTNSQSSLGLRMGISEFTARGTTMYQLAHGLAQRLEKPVIDDTGLSGNYDFTLTFRPEAPGAATAENADAPSIFAALPEQLGLRLESGRGPVDTIVIDHVEKLDAN